MICLEAGPGTLDVVEFGRVFGEPFDDKPVRAFGKRSEARPALVNGAVIQHEDDGLCRHAGSRAEQMIEASQQGDEVGAFLGVRFLVCDVSMTSVRVIKSSAPSMAILRDCPGAGTRKSAPRFAQARAK